MSEARLPAGLEVSALVRRVQNEGGFATVIAKGHPEAGTLMALTYCNNANFRAWERMPQADGERRWTCVREAENGSDPDWMAWLERRKAQDSDLWIIELDIADGERFIPAGPLKG